MTIFSVAIALGRLIQDPKLVLSDAPEFEDLPSLPNISFPAISLSSQLRLAIPGNNTTLGDLLTQVTPTELLVPPIRPSLFQSRMISSTSKPYFHSAIISCPENDKWNIDSRPPHLKRSYPFPIDTFLLSHRMRFPYLTMSTTICT